MKPYIYPETYLQCIQWKHIEQLAKENDTPSDLDANEFDTFRRLFKGAMGSWEEVALLCLTAATIHRDESEGDRDAFTQLLLDHIALDGDQIGGSLDDDEMQQSLIEADRQALRDLRVERGEEDGS